MLTLLLTCAARPGAAASASDTSTVAAFVPDAPPFSSNVRINSDPANDQWEVAVAADVNGNLYAGWQDTIVTQNSTTAKCAFARSSDGGRSWSVPELYQPPMPNQPSIGGDPVVVADDEGGFYRLCMGVDVRGNYDLAVARSGDGGATWGEWRQFRGGDKPWLAARGGLLYLVYKEGSGGVSLFTRSEDEGRTWSPPVSLAMGQGACVAVDAQGAVYLAWGFRTVSAEWNWAQFQRSLDGGKTWGEVKKIGPGSWIHTEKANKKPISLAASVASCVVDASGRDVWVAWATCKENDAYCERSNDDVFVAHSADGGEVWEAPVKVNDDGNSSVSNVFPWMARDCRGTLHVAWIDDRGGGVEAWYSNSSDGGRTWTKNIPVTDVAPTPWAGRQGDYTTLVITPSGEVGYAWADTRRGGELDVYYSSARIAAPGPCEKGGLARIEVSPPVASITADQTQQFTAKGYDKSGQPVNIAPLWSASGGSVDPAGLYTPDQVGTFEVEARLGVVGGKASITVNPGVPARIEVSPPSAAITVDETVAFSASGVDGKGNPTSVSPAWSATGGSVDGSGLYTPSSDGAFTVTASDRGASGSATVTVTPGKIVALVVEPAAATVRADSTLALKAIGVDSKGNRGEVLTAWRVDGAPGAGRVDQAGVYDPIKTGEYSVIAESSGLTDRSAVTVVPGRLHTAAIEPAGATLAVGDKVQFSVRAEDEEANQIANVQVVWRGGAAPGDISATGEFTGRREGSGAVAAEVSDGEASVEASAKVTVSSGARWWPWLPLLVIGIGASAAVAAAASRRARCSWCGAKHSRNAPCARRDWR
jgi:hypothetical protein